jgi:thioredoxin-dependent peroxiredoxin
MKVGDPFPKIKLTNQYGKLIDFENIIGNMRMVFFFYPKDFTQGCTKEACGFRDNYDAFEKLNCKVFGVSSDSEKRHLLFAKKFNLNFDLITDNGNQLATLFEVKRNLFGLIPGRVTFIFDERGVCKGSFNSMRDAEGHIKYALNCLKELQ